MACSDNAWSYSDSQANAEEDMAQKVAQSVIAGIMSTNRNNNNVNSQAIHAMPITAMSPPPSQNSTVGSPVDRRKEALARLQSLGNSM